MLPMPALCFAPQEGFPDGWLAYWNRTYWSVADALASNKYWTGKPVWVELLGEPDLGQPNAPTWGWVSGIPTRQLLPCAWHGVVMLLL